MNQENAYISASKIFDYYYNNARKKFDEGMSKSLAQHPADYVYNSLISGKDCYINDECCLEYCMERLDTEFDRMDPDLKRQIYEKAFKVRAGNVSNFEINTKLKAKRRKKINELYYNRYRKALENQENDFINAFKINLSIKRKPSDEMASVLKKLNLF